MLGRDIFVLKIVGLFEGALQQLVQCRGRGRLRGSAGHLGQTLDLPIGLTQDRLRADADLLQNRRHDAFAVFDESCQQMQRHQLGVAVLGGEVVGALDRFLRLYRKSVPTDGHGVYS